MAQEKRVLDRVQTSTLLAKVHAHLGTGDTEAARTYARMLYKQLQEAGLLERPPLAAGIFKGKA